jgi:hypothetical protein
MLAVLAASGAVAPATKTALIITIIMVSRFRRCRFLWPVFRAIEWRWWANGLRIGGISVMSDLGLLRSFRSIPDFCSSHL